jgi:hypothetical protein
MLELAYPEMDFANRWCWQNIRPNDGLCEQADSEYPACTVTEPHRHEGRWIGYFFGKSDYNFGPHEWYFSDESDRDKFLECVPLINWGEKYPRTDSPRPAGP